MIKKFKMLSNMTLVMLIFFSMGAMANQVVVSKIKRLEIDKKPSEVFVISTLYKRHETTPVYDLGALRQLILKIDPDVFVLDVTPNELLVQKVWPGKVEYAGVIFPLINQRKATAYASEPGQPLFSQLSGPVGDAYKKAKTEAPQTMAVLEEHEHATYAVLQKLWQQSSAINSEISDQLIGAKRDAENRLVGTAAEVNQRKWNEHHTDKLLEAAKKNPGKRIIMLVGIESRYEVMRLLKTNESILLVDVESWLNQKE